MNKVLMKVHDWYTDKIIFIEKSMYFLLLLNFHFIDQILPPFYWIREMNFGFSRVMDIKDHEN